MRRGLLRGSTALAVARRTHTSHFTLHTHATHIYAHTHSHLDSGWVWFRLALGVLSRRSATASRLARQGRQAAPRACPSRRPYPGCRRPRVKAIGLVSGVAFASNRATGWALGLATRPSQRSFEKLCGRGRSIALGGYYRRVEPGQPRYGKASAASEKAAIGTDPNLTLSPCPTREPTLNKPTPNKPTPKPMVTAVGPRAFTCRFFSIHSSADHTARFLFTARGLAMRTLSTRPASSDSCMLSIASAASSSSSKVTKPKPRGLFVECSLGMSTSLISPKGMNAARSSSSVTSSAMPPTYRWFFTRFSMAPSLAARAPGFRAGKGGRGAPGDGAA
mmetsp:Transcript_21014/g.64016  ORF Transcript_21014/g.64016 Transcript_21014/m.64016 type:complete len:334 (-) Transcript_21014:10-1011(-)